MIDELACDGTATLPEAKAPRKSWQLITCEYPPQLGGVSDYALPVAEHLAQCGDEVHVWCPPGEPRPRTRGVTVHDTCAFDSIAGLRRMGKQLDRFPAPSRNLLVQWVPHGYGLRSMNLPFCLWLWSRAAWRGDRVEIMVHEAYLPFREGSRRQDAVALVHRLMTIILLRAASKVWVSITAWEAHWRPYALGKRISFTWLPLPSTVQVAREPGDLGALRNRYTAPGGKLIGHFGTFGPAISNMLAEIIPSLLGKHSEASIILIGPRSELFRQKLLALHGELAARVHALGPMSATDPELSRHISACDVMIQPYPDGVNSRRTSAMAPLAHGVAMVTTGGRYTEDVWIQSGGAAVAPTGDLNAFVEVTGKLLVNDAERARIGARAKTVYKDTFDLKHVIAVLRGKPSDNYRGNE